MAHSPVKHEELIGEDDKKAKVVIIMGIIGQAAGGREVLQKVDPPLPPAYFDK
jgi:hypothetical protein